MKQIMITKWLLTTYFSLCNIQRLQTYKMGGVGLIIYYKDKHQELISFTTPIPVIDSKTIENK